MKSLQYFLIVLLASVTVMACVDRDFDETPAAGEVDPMIPPDQQITIAEVKALYQEGAFVQITSDKYLRGVINADDEAGNIFKSLIIQDSLSYSGDNVAGMTIIVDVNEMHTRLFAGREVFIQVKDLYISDFAGLIQIGYGEDNEGNMVRIPQSVADEIIVPGIYLGEPVPTKIAVTDLNSSYQSVLVQLDNVEVAPQDLNTTFGNVQTERTTNTTFVNCQGDEVVVRGSAFSDFAGTEVPAGNGSMVGVFGEFNNTRQVTIRDLNDLDMTGARCDGSSGGGANELFDDNGDFVGDISKVISIGDLKSTYYRDDEVTLIEDDLIVRGQVISDDVTGNFFKEVIFQDATSGLKVRIDAFDLYQEYPLGSDIAIKLQGLSIGAFNGLIQIGEGSGSDVNRIDESRYKSFVFGGKDLGTPTSISLSIAELDDSHQNRLVRVNNVEFASNELGQPYSAPDFTTNRTIRDCASSSAILRTSSFADFAAATVPDGNGTITAVYGVFGSDQQLLIRSLNDVDLNGVRCNTNTGGANELFDDNGNFIGDANKLISIADLKGQYYMQDAVTTINDDRIIRGQVISSDETGNFFKEVVFQDATSGIKVRIDAFDLHQEYPIGSDIAVKLQGLSIGAFNGLIQIGIGSGDNINRIEEGQFKDFVFGGANLGTPMTTSVSIVDLDDSYQNRLIRISDLEFAAGELGQPYSAADFSTNRTISDCDGNVLLLRTSSFANFAATTVPDGNGSITAVYGVFGADRQLFIRDLNDVDFNGMRCDGGGTGGGDGMLPEDFEGGADFQPFAGEGWINTAIAGDRVWIKRSFDNNGFVEARGFDEALPQIDTWLITPEVDLGQFSTLNFLSATAFYTHDGLTVWVSPAFDDVADATWTQLTPTLAGSGQANFDWVESGDVSISGSGTVRIGFRYQGDNSVNTGTFRIDDVRVK